MNINRNDPCPCGSGKKYKKCCLHNQNVVLINEVKEERFYQFKHSLVLKLNSFFDKKFPFNQRLVLQAEFSKRSDHLLPKDAEESFFQFWLYFCRTFDNGLRGVEWFLEEQRARLSNEERKMLEEWKSLTLKLVQAVDLKDDTVIFEDIWTKEQYSVQNSKENIPDVIPWYSTIGLLEFYEGKYYFNGVRSFKGPKELQQVANLVKELVESKNLSFEKTMFDFYPEILTVFFSEENRTTKNKQKTKEIKQTTLEYRVTDESVVKDFVYEQENYVIQEWNNDRKVINWAGGWRTYQDSELNGEIHLAEVYGMILIEGDLLQFSTIMEDKAEKFKAIVEEWKSAAVFIEKKTKSIPLPFDAEVRNMFAQMEKNTPSYFSLYAQNATVDDLNTPIPMYDHLSLHDLIQNGRLVDADSWLKQSEYNMYLLVLKQNGNVEVTADFNTIRKQLALPLSPFVTGGEKRSSSIVFIDSPPDKPQIVKDSDIPYFEELGFTPSTINNFYALDLLEFYKEKTIGKGENTVRKYRNGLFFLREALMYHEIQSWEDCSYAFWNQVISKDFPSQHEGMSKTFIKDFFSTMKAITKWIDSKKKTSISKDVQSVIAEVEPELLKLIESF